MYPDRLFGNRTNIFVSATSANRRVFAFEMSLGLNHKLLGTSCYLSRTTFMYQSSTDRSFHHTLYIPFYILNLSPYHSTPVSPSWNIFLWNLFVMESGSSIIKQSASKSVCKIGIAKLYGTRDIKVNRLLIGLCASMFVHIYLLKNGAKYQTVPFWWTTQISSQGKQAGRANKQSNNFMPQVDVKKLIHFNQGWWGFLVLGKINYHTWEIWDLFQWNFQLKGSVKNYINFYQGWWSFLVRGKINYHTWEIRGLFQWNFQLKGNVKN